MIQAELFSPELAQKAKRKGMSLAAQNRKALLEACRSALAAIAIARPSREASADDAQQWLISRGHNSRALGNAAGSLFAGNDWEFVRYVKSWRTTNHSRVIAVWRLR